MVRTYKRKTERGGWDPESMKNAIEAVMCREMGYKKAADSFQVPQTTLERRVKLARGQNERNDNMPTFTVSTSGTIYTGQQNPILAQSLGPIKTVFTVEEESLLFNYLLKMEERLFGLTSYDLRVLAYQWAEKLGKDHTFSRTKQAAGKDWLSGFRSRHPRLSLRKPEATSAARAAAFNKVNVSKFFDLLSKVVDRHKFTAEKIYNCDETGVTVVPKHRSKILSLKGRKQVGVLTSAERGNTITIEVCYSAAGSYMPPLFVFPRVRANNQLLNDCPPGAWAEFHPSGWMQSHIFFAWFKKFVEWSRPTKESPVLLLLDGHFTHTKNLEVIDHARENGVVLLCFPPHCTHRLQPLDVSFMKPLSTFYDHEVSGWLRTNPGRVVSMYQIAKLYGNAFVKAATMSTAINGFKKTGIWPVNQGVFEDHDYAPSETTDRPLHPPDTAPAESAASTTLDVVHAQTVISSNLQPAASETATSTILTATNLTDETETTQNFDTIQNSESNVISATPKAAKIPSRPISQCPTPEDILPIPSTSGQHLKKTTRKHGKTAVLTESPYKNELLTEINIKKEKEWKKKEKSRKKLIDSFSRKTAVENQKGKKKLTKIKTDHGEKLKKSKQTKKKTTVKRKRSQSSSSDESDAECLYCGRLYSQSTVGWIQCWKCKRWAHCTCAGEEDEDDEAAHLCTQCQDSD